MCEAPLGPSDSSCITDVSSSCTKVGRICPNCRYTPFKRPSESSLPKNASESVVLVEEATATHAAPTIDSTKKYSTKGNVLPRTASVGCSTGVGTRRKAQAQSPGLNMEKRRNAGHSRNTHGVTSELQAKNSAVDLTLVSPAFDLAVWKEQRRVRYLSRILDKPDVCLSPSSSSSLPLVNTASPDDKVVPSSIQAVESANSVVLETSSTTTAAAVLPACTSSTVVKAQQVASPPLSALKAKRKRGGSNVVQRKPRISLYHLLKQKDEARSANPISSSSEDLLMPSSFVHADDSLLSKFLQ